jgi:hypothetical protein
MHVRAALQRLRDDTRLGDTDAALARKLTLDPATVGRVLRGRGRASKKVASAVAEYLGVDVGEVLEGRVPLAATKEKT